MNNIKQDDFIKELVKLPNIARTYDELASLFSVSTRTIRNRCEKINEVVKLLKLENIIEYGVGTITYKGDESDTEALNKYFSKINFYDFYLSNSERITIISLMLLTSDSYLTIHDFTDPLFISKSTFLADINKIRTFLNENKINLISNSKGYIVETTEINRQNVICNVCFPYLNNTSFVFAENHFSQNLLNIVLQISNIIEEVSKIVCDVENIFNMSLSDIFYKQTIYMLAILCSRLSKNKFIDKVDFIDDNLQKTPSYEIAHSLVRRCATELKLEFTEKEVLYLAWKLHVYHIDFTKDFEHSTDLFFFNEITRFLALLDKQIGTNFTNDREFSLMFVKHIWSIKNGSLGEYDFNNMMLMENYPLYFNVISNNISIINNCIERECTKNEMISILLYVVSEFERHDGEKERTKVIVLCHVGLGTGYFLANRLKETFNVNIVEVSSIHKLPSLINKNNYDLIVSTVPLLEKNINYIQVTPSLNERDIVVVQKAIARSQRNKQNHSNNRTNKCDLEDIADSIYICEKEECKNWEDAIDIAAKPLLKNKIIEQSYIDAIKKSVEINGPYFAFWPGIMLAHAAPSDGVNRVGISIYKTNKELPFLDSANSPIKIVIVAAIFDTNSEFGYLSKIMNLFSNENFLTNFKKTKDKDDIKKLIINY